MVIREVNEAVKASILRSFSAREVELADRVDSDLHSWGWCDGVVLFPQGKCPYCHATITSNRIWKIGRQSVDGRWKVVDGQVVKDDRADHPHARYTYGGPVCTGDASDTLTALFFGMNPGDAMAPEFRNRGRDPWNEWLARVFDHVCPQLNGRTHVHQFESVCVLLGCEVRFVSGMAGCGCGCRCHPFEPCECGHNLCYCPRPSWCVQCKEIVVAGTGMYCFGDDCHSALYCAGCYERDGHAEHGPDEEDDEDSDDDADWKCTNCDTSDIDLRSDCCLSVCVGCHGDSF